MSRPFGRLFLFVSNNAKMRRFYHDLRKMWHNHAGGDCVDQRAMGKRIRRARRMLDLTQEQLAEMAGVSTSFVGHIERGTRVPSAETLYKLCRAVEITMEHAITGE